MLNAFIMHFSVTSASAYCMVCSIFKQGSIRYESIGIFPAQTFFEVNTVSGAVNIIRSVRDDVILRASYTVSPTQFPQTLIQLKYLLVSIEWQ